MFRSSKKLLKVSRRKRLKLLRSSNSVKRNQVRLRFYPTPTTIAIEEIRKTNILHISAPFTQLFFHTESTEVSLAGGFVSAAELPADILLIPQACLAGKRKGNNMQYHQLIDKTLGHQLFEVSAPESLTSRDD